MVPIRPGVMSFGSRQSTMSHGNFNPRMSTWGSDGRRAPVSRASSIGQSFRTPVDNALGRSLFSLDEVVEEEVSKSSLPPFNELTNFSNLNEKERASVMRIFHTEDADDEDAARLQDILLNAKQQVALPSAFEVTLRSDLQTFEQSLIAAHKQALGIDEESVQRMAEKCDRLHGENERLKRELAKMRRRRSKQHQQRKASTPEGASPATSADLPFRGVIPNSCNGDAKDDKSACNGADVDPGQEEMGTKDAIGYEGPAASYRQVSMMTTIIQNGQHDAPILEEAQDNESASSEIFRPSVAWRQVTPQDHETRGAVAVTSAEQMVNFWQEAGGLVGDEAQRQGPVARLFQRMVILESSCFRLTWDAVCWIILMYEAVFTPLTLLDAPHTLGTAIMDWTARLYWTVDFALCFFTTYTGLAGEVEQRVEFIVSRYLRGWFVVDLTLLLIDWAEFYVGGWESAAPSTARLIKLARALRVLRVFRMVRVVATKQMPESLQGVKLVMNSELFDVTCHMLKWVIAVIVYNHTLGCIFYALADIGERSDSWLSAMNLVNSDLFERYIHCFHWAMGNFHGTSDIGATTVAERAFTVGSMIIAVFGSNVVVSKMTSALTRLEILTATQSSKMNALRQFLVDNRISPPVMVKITKSAQARLEELKRNVPEDSIELLALLPDTVRAEMHADMFTPLMKPHPCFGALFKDIHQGGILCTKVFNECVHRVIFLSGDMLFSVNQETSVAYFVVHGRLCYLRRGYPLEYAGRGDWLCEATLWTSWTPYGALLAKKEASCLTLDAAEFQRIYRHVPECAILLRKYAAFFCKALNDMDEEDLTDINTLLSTMKDWVDDYLSRRAASMRSARSTSNFVGRAVTKAFS